MPTGNSLSSGQVACVTTALWYKIEMCRHDQLVVNQTKLSALRYEQLSEVALLWVEANSLSETLRPAKNLSTPIPAHSHLRLQGALRR
jgi:hypothetical protein